MPVTLSSAACLGQKSCRPVAVAPQGYWTAPRGRRHAAPLVSRWTIPGEAGMQGRALGPWGSCQCFEAELRLPVADLPRVNFCARIRLERQWHQSVGVCDCRCLDTLSR